MVSIFDGENYYFKNVFKKIKGKYGFNRISPFKNEAIQKCFSVVDLTKAG